MQYSSSRRRGPVLSNAYLNLSGVNKENVPSTRPKGFGGERFTRPEELDNNYNDERNPRVDGRVNYDGRREGANSDTTQSTRIKKATHPSQQTSRKWLQAIAVAILLCSSATLIYFHCFYADATHLLNDPLTPSPPSHPLLPPTFWINLDTSDERRKGMMTSFSSLGITNARRVSASNVTDTLNRFHSGQLVLNPKVKLEQASGEVPTWKKHAIKNIYHYEEAACLLSHLNAIKQAYDEGHPLALILEDDAKLSSTFLNEWRDYIELAPKDWKILQFATNNGVIMRQGALLQDPFFSWQPYHWSTRAYMVNRAGMKTLMDKIFSLSSEGKDIWSFQHQEPMVVSDEVVYAVIGDAYTSTGLWVDGLSFSSTVQVNNPGLVNSYLPSVVGDLAQQVAMKKETKTFNESLLVLMSARISNEKDIKREVARISQDVHGVCKFHRKCTWIVNVVATDSILMSKFKGLSSEMPPNVHFQATVSPSPFNNFSFIKKSLGEVLDFDLVLIKDNDMRTSGFPWQSFVERKGDAVVAGPLRQTASEAMTWSKFEEKSQRFLLHEANPWTVEGHNWASNLFANIEPTEVPLLEHGFVLLDAKFANYFFNITLTSSFVEQVSDWGPDYLWCQAAVQWATNKRPGCYLIPVVSSHDDTRQIAKTKEYMDAGLKMLDEFSMDPIFQDWMKLSTQWSHIIGGKSLSDIEKNCRALTGQRRSDSFDLHACSKLGSEEEVIAAWARENNWCDDCQFRTARFNCRQRVEWEMEKWGSAELEAKRANLEHCTSPRAKRLGRPREGQGGPLDNAK